MRVPRVGKQDGVDPRGDQWGKTIWDPKLKIPVFPHYTRIVVAVHAGKRYSNGARHVVVVCCGVAIGAQ